MQQPKMTTAASTLAVVLLAAGSCTGDPVFDFGPGQGGDAASTVTARRAAFEGLVCSLKRGS